MPKPLIPQSFLVFSWHSKTWHLSPQAFFFSLYWHSGGNSLSEIQASTDRYCPYDITAHPGNTAHFTVEVPSHLLLSMHNFTKGHAVRNPPLPSGFILLKYTHRFWRKTTVSRNGAEQRLNTHAHSESDLYHTQSSAHPTPLEVTLLPHEAPHPGHYPVTQLLMAVKDQSSWGKGNWGNAYFSSPVFTAVPVQLFRKQVQLQYPKFKNLTHSVFNACGFIKPQIHHESTEKIIKHHSGTQLFSHFQHKHWEHWPAICKHFHCHLAERQPFQPQLNSHFMNSIQQLPDCKCSEKNNFIYS